MTDLTACRKVRDSEERKKRERKIMPLRVANTFMPAAQGQHTHSAQINFSAYSIGIVV